MANSRACILNPSLLVAHIYLSNQEYRKWCFHARESHLSPGGKYFYWKLNSTPKSAFSTIGQHIYCWGQNFWSKKSVPLWRKEKKKRRERKEVGWGEAECTKKDLRSLLGKQTAFAKHRFDELSANESGIMRNTWAKFSLKYTSLKIKRKKCLGKMCFKFSPNRKHLQTGSSYLLSPPNDSVGPSEWQGQRVIRRQIHIGSAQDRALGWSWTPWGL